MKLSRRALLGALPLAASRTRFRFAICNETFEGASFAEGCHIARRTGYEGLEIAPFTLAEAPAAIPDGRRRALRAEMADAGVAFVGLHAFLSSPKGLHLTAPDASLRARSWEYFRRLIGLAADLGAGCVMVLGSSRQRAAVDGATVAEATARLREGLAQMAPHATARGVTVLVEPLAPHLCNVVNSLDEAMDIVRAIGSPAVQTMFDTHNAVREEIPHSRAIRRYFRHIRHVHLNEMDGRHPGTGGYDFPDVLHALDELGYSGWLSLEVFDFRPGGERIARDSRNYLREIEAKIH